MFDEDFCSLLEYRLCAFFEQHHHEATNGFWCDGILLSEPDSYYSTRYVNKHRQTILTALTGKDGQTPYQLILHFGNKALSLCARQLNISPTLPDADDTERYHINTLEKRIEIQLD